MADESPEQIKERVHAEELAKGSDPRVAEGRAKAAEARAREGLPIEPDKAWRAKLEKEGGAPREASAEQTAEAASPAEAPAAAGDATARDEAAVAEQQPAAVEQPVRPEREAEVAKAPAQAPAAALDLPGEPEPRAAAAPAAVPVATVEPGPTPEIGDPIELDTEGLEEIAGIKIRDPRLPAWLLVALFAIAMWAMAYLLFAGGTSSSEVTGCQVESGGALVCSSPPAPGEAGEPAAH